MNNKETPKNSNKEINGELHQNIDDWAKQAFKHGWIRKKEWFDWTELSASIASYVRGEHKKGSKVTNQETERLPKPVSDKGIKQKQDPNKEEWQKEFKIFWNRLINGELIEERNRAEILMWAIIDEFIAPLLKTQREEYIKDLKGVFPRGKKGKKFSAEEIADIAIIISKRLHKLIKKYKG